jgi:hypothetical protein
VRLSVRERRMQYTNATKVRRKSGGAHWRDSRVLTQTLQPVHKRLKTGTGGHGLYLGDHVDSN